MIRIGFIIVMHAEMRNSIIVAALLALLCSCSNTALVAPGIYPEYQDVTIPCNIAPLNFRYEGASRPVTTFTYDGKVIRKRGKKVCWDLDQWREMLSEAAGRDIVVESSVLPGWVWHVSGEPIDSYLSYRLIEPGFEVWNEVEIEERCLEDFSTRTLSSYRNTANKCMNCHIHSHSRGDLSMLYVRGTGGGAILNRDGALRKLDLRDSLMISSTVYGEIHPSGRWGVFSTNVIIPGFHTAGSARMEIFDTASDLVVADFDSCRMITTPAFARGDTFETFPAFSADGSEVFYCSADTVSLPGNVKNLRYALLRTPFRDGMLGPQMDTVRSLSSGGSVCHPKASPDGRWLMYTVADYGTFPIWHQECHLELMDLTTGEIVPTDGLHADRSDTYHSWSSGGRWFVFASKRGDGQYGKPYFCHIDADGNISKPFVLPQKDPSFYDFTLLSFNIPDLSSSPVPFDSDDVARLLDTRKSESFE